MQIQNVSVSFFFVIPKASAGWTLLLHFGTLELLIADLYQFISRSWIEHCFHASDSKLLRFWYERSYRFFWLILLINSQFWSKREITIPSDQDSRLQAQHIQHVVLTSPLWTTCDSENELIVAVIVLTTRLVRMWSYLFKTCSRITSELIIITCPDCQIGEKWVSPSFTFRHETAEEQKWNGKRWLWKRFSETELFCFLRSAPSSKEKRRHNNLCDYCWDPQQRQAITPTGRQWS